MAAGARDTFITFQDRTVTQDPVYGTSQESWSDHSQAWAEVMDVLPSRSESLDDSISIQKRPARIRVDYFDGVTITSAMRIVIAADDINPERKLRIVAGPAMKGHRKEWEIMAEELSTEGQAP